MANSLLKNPGNAPGTFYVDETCIDCDLCRAHASSIFQRNDELGATIVARQPLSLEEIALATEAMHDCPSDSIGNDGASQTVQ